MYDLYRRLSLESLQAEADLRASTLADAYQANLAALAKQQLLAVRYGSTPDRDAWHQAEQQRLYAEYSAQLDDLGSQIEAQTAAIHADYDAKDQAYTDAFSALAPAAGVSAAAGWGASAPSPYAPRIISDTPTAHPPDMPAWSEPEPEAESPSIWGRIASLFG